MRHKLGLELVEVDAKSTIEPERGSDRGHDLRGEAVKVEVCVRRSLDVEVAVAVDGLVSSIGQHSGSKVMVASDSTDDTVV